MKKSLLFLALILAASMNAQTTYSATEDAYVKGGENADDTFGISDEGNLEVKIGTLENYMRRIFVKFDLSAEGINEATVQGATLRLYTTKVNECQITASETTDGWKETEVTWNNAPVSGAAIDAKVISNNEAYYEWDVTAYVKSQLAGDKIISISVEDLGAENNEVNFNSSEADANTPELVINTTLSTSSFDEKKNLISLYPNPASDVLNIKVVSGKVNNLTIFDLTGKALYKTDDANKSSQIDISWLSDGFYILKAETEAGSQSMKFVKK